MSKYIRVVVIVMLGCHLTISKAVAEESITSEIFRIGIFRVPSDIVNTELQECVGQIAFIAPLPIDIEIQRGSQEDKIIKQPNLKIPQGFYTTQKLFDVLSRASSEAFTVNNDASGIRVVIGSIDANKNILDAKVNKGERIRGNLSDVVSWLKVNVPEFSIMHQFSGMGGASQALDLVITPSMTVRDVLTAACRLTECRWTAEVYQERVAKNWSYLDSKGVKVDLGPVLSPVAKISINKKIVRRKDFVTKIEDVQIDPRERSK